MSHPQWFADPSRPLNTTPAPPVIIIDEFYPDPNAIRRIALSQEFVQYIPPDPRIVGPELAAREAQRQGRWLSTAFVTYHGENARNPFYGWRYNPAWLLAKLEDAVGEAINFSNWDGAGDFWNGAFHLVEGGFAIGEGVVHHHYKPGDIENRGWSGVVYLSPEAPATSGTSFWRHRRSGRCVASFGEEFPTDPTELELVYLAENRFNRAVLFRENIWHRVEHGFGAGTEARLTQTLFFEVAATPCDRQQGCSAAED